jgi:hypothetical protein
MKRHTKIFPNIEEVVETIEQCKDKTKRIEKINEIKNNPHPCYQILTYHDELLTKEERKILIDRILKDSNHSLLYVTNHSPTQQQLQFIYNNHFYNYLTFYGLSRLKDIKNHFVNCLDKGLDKIINQIIKEENIEIISKFIILYKSELNKKQKDRLNSLKVVIELNNKN